MRKKKKKKSSCDALNWFQTVRRPVFTGGWLQIIGSLWGRVVCTIIQVESKTLNPAITINYFVNSTLYVPWACVNAAHRYNWKQYWANDVDFVSEDWTHHRREHTSCLLIVIEDRRGFYFILHTFFSPVIHIDRVCFFSSEMGRMLTCSSSTCIHSS